MAADDRGLAFAEEREQGVPSLAQLVIDEPSDAVPGDEASAVSSLRCSEAVLLAAPTARATCLILAGRATPTLEKVQALIERLNVGGYGRSLVYSALCGVGKTVLLMEFDVLASEAGSP